jgi:outer membrane protein assembly factor BamD (BamD/ComL family)
MFLFYLYYCGCVSITRRTEKDIEEYYALPAHSNEVLDKKIESLNKLLYRNDLSENQKKTATYLLQTYEKIKALNKGNAPREDYIKSIQILFNSIGIIEQQYLFSDLVINRGIEKEIINGYLSLKKEIYEAYLADNLNDVISKSSKLESTYGKSSITPDIGIILVDSLSRSSMAGEAISTAKEIYSENESMPDMVDLLSYIIDMETKVGNTKGANYFFERLVDLIDEKNNTFKHTESMLAKTGRDSSKLDAAIDKNISDISPEKAALAEQKINNVKKLLSRNDFEGARLILLRWRLTAEEGPELDMIEEALKSVDAAEKKYSNSNSKDQSILEDAKRKMEDEKYEEALNILKPLTSEGSNFEAEKLKNLAIDKHINNERLKAAKLFVAAGEEKDIQKKKELLLKSKKILESLINKYPETPLLEKLNNYITKINIELDHL